MAAINVKVTDRHSTYTARAQGWVASCTGGARFAVERLAEKLLGEHQRRTITRIDAGGTYGVEHWQIAIDETQLCRVCGCRWSAPCAGGCSWVEADLCSACAATAEGIQS